MTLEGGGTDGMLNISLTIQAIRGGHVTVYFNTSASEIIKYVYRNFFIDC